MHIVCNAKMPLLMNTMPKVTQPKHVLIVSELKKKKKKVSKVLSPGERSKNVESIHSISNV